VVKSIYNRTGAISVNGLRNVFAQNTMFIAH